MTKHRFRIGQKVKVIKNGHGCAYNEVGRIVTITKLGAYNLHGGEKGYRVDPAIGNTLNHQYDGFIGETSFKPICETWRDKCGV